LNHSLLVKVDSAPVMLTRTWASGPRPRTDPKAKALSHKAKDLSHKAKATDLDPKAKAKDLSHKAKAKD